MTKKPTGYIAICTGCRAIIGAIDMHRTDNAETGRIMGEWVAKGYELHPRFTGDWSERLTCCKCG